MIDKDSNRNKKFVVLFILSVITCSLPIAIVHLLYSTESPIIITSISADGVLEYIGTVCGIIISVFIAILTIRSEWRKMYIEQREKDYNTKRPYFMIEKIYWNDGKNNEIEYDTNCYKGTLNGNQMIVIELLNVGDGPALNFQHHNSNKENDSFTCGFKPITTVREGTTTSIHLKRNIDTEPIEDKITVLYENILGLKYSQEIKYTLAKYDRQLSPDKNLMNQINCSFEQLSEQKYK